MSTSSLRRDVFGLREYDLVSHKRHDILAQQSLPRYEVMFTQLKKSPARRSLEVDIPRATVYKIMHKRLKLYPYKIQLLHEIKPEDQPKRTEFVRGENSVVASSCAEQILVHILKFSEAIIKLFEFFFHIIINK